MDMTAPAQWLNVTFADFDLNLTLLIHKLYELAGWFFSPLFEGLAVLGSPAGCIVILLFLLFFIKKARPFIFAMIFSMLIGVLITNFGIKLLVQRPRPYADTGSVFYQLWVMMGSHMEKDLSFPSGHATGAFAMTFPILYLSGKRVKWFALLYAFLIIISRVYLVVHFPTDVIAGAFVGILSSIMGTFAAKKLPHTFYTYDFFKKKPEKAA